ncbi:hypothetical protein [Actinophytocola glycyrrhizae]|uniref:Excreted virulence factor EspC (Type VII ESX diderm) n=1 Tax=Actinophytocola glycyrrhizae TaxID=2044873 RepID=A0ABV9RY26_9PSEU
MTGIKFDATWVGGYAQLAGNSAEALAEGVRTMAIEPLDQESFGQLGRTVHTTQAYGKAAQLLREQLARAVEALGAASDGLAKVTAGYVDTDDEGGVTIRREER